MSAESFGPSNKTMHHASLQNEFEMIHGTIERSCGERADPAHDQFNRRRRSVRSANSTAAPFVAKSSFLQGIHPAQVRRLPAPAHRRDSFTWPRIGAASLRGSVPPPPESEAQSSAVCTNRRGRTMIAESHDLHIVQFPRPITALSSYLSGIANGCVFVKLDARATNAPARGQYNIRVMGASSPRRIRYPALSGNNMLFKCNISR